MSNNYMQSIGWLNGQWGNSEDLTFPLTDRSLKLSDGIFETILILNGKPQLLNAHLKRWYETASALYMATPPKEEWLNKLIYEGIQKLNLNKGNGALRLNWSRGNNCYRGITVIPEQAQEKHHYFWLEISKYSPNFNEISVCINQQERRNAYSLLSKYKTFSYTQSIQVRLEANKKGFDDALLLSTNGDICCGSTSNLIVLRNNEFITPPLTTGCLAGIMRSQGIKKKIFNEEKISMKPQKKDQWFLINSLSCHPIKRINETTLSVKKDSTQIWYSLLENDIINAN